MASHSSDEDDPDDFITLGTPVPEIDEDYESRKPITPQDLTAKDKQGRRRFHGAFTGGFSAGFFNSVGTKEGFTPSTFVSSKNRRLKDDDSGQGRPSLPEDFMDEEDMEEFGIAPRKFATAGNFTSEERKRKRLRDVNQIAGSSSLDGATAFNDLFVPENLTVGIKLLRKMGWREGQGLGPRVEKKKKKKRAAIAKPGLKVYGCALPPSDDSDSSEEFVPQDMSSVTFAPKDITPICVKAKENVHGLGYQGLNPALALPSSHINLFSAPPVRSKSGSRGISGQAFGVGAFEDEDEDIYAVDSMSNYDITMQTEEEGDNKFGWTAPRSHGKQSVPVTYVGKLLEGFTLSKSQLKPKKKFPAPSLPRGFKCHHWFRKQREESHIPEHLRNTDAISTGGLKMNATDRGILLGETPIMSSVFDLIPKADRDRIDATKEAIGLTKSLPSRQNEPEEPQSTVVKSEENLPNPASTPSSFLSRFQPATSPHIESSHESDQGQRAPLFQSGLTFQPFRKDQAKQKRYDQYLTLIKQGASEAYSAVASPEMTEWEKAREKDEFSKAAKMFRPMSAMMSSRFVSGAMIDDDMVEVSADSGPVKSDESKAAEMKMFGKLTREEQEWHPHPLLCKRFNVPNPYPGSDVLGIPGVKRDKYSVFNFLSFGDFQSGETQEPSPAVQRQEETDRSKMSVGRPKKATMASVFKVLDDPNFNKTPVSSEKRTSLSSSTSTTAAAATPEKSSGEGNVVEEEEIQDNEEPAADMDLFRAIFKNSDSEDSEEEEDKDVNEKSSSEAEQDSAESIEVEAESVLQDDREEQVVVKSEPPQDSEATPVSFHPMFTRPKTAAEATDLEKATAQPGQDLPEAMSRVASDSTKVQRHWKSNLGNKSIFSVLENMEQSGKPQEPSSAQSSNHKPGMNSSNVGDVDSGEDYGPRLPGSDRLGPAAAEKPRDDDTGEDYGPRLPGNDRLWPAAAEKSRDGKDDDDEDDAATTYGPSLPPPTSVEDRGRSTEKHRRGRDSSRSGHRKEKKKKSKHRKQKKHRKHKKSSKSRRKSKVEDHSSSGSEADTESDSAESVSDADLLERLRDISKSPKSKSLQKIKRL